jgi:phosphoglycerate dehydrogenase-like enzyme
MRLFFPPPVLSALKTLIPNLIVINEDDLKTPRLEALLVEHEVEILIAGWSTPGLSQDFANASASLRYYCYLTGSVRPKVPKALVEAGLIVTNWGPTISRTVAEAALMLTMMSLRRAPLWHDVMHHERGWAENQTFAGQFALQGRRVGMHGFGNIARALREMLRPFEAEVSTYSPPVSDEVLEAHEVKRCHSLEELFRDNQIVIELAALTDETRGSVTEELLRMLPEDGVFVNVGRGAVVDEAGLIRVATEGRIRIGLDVFSEEPLPPDSPLRGNQNVALMPHLAGPTEDRIPDLGRYANANIARYLAGENLLSVISAANYDSIT